MFLLKLPVFILIKLVLIFKIINGHVIVQQSDISHLSHELLQTTSLKNGSTPGPITEDICGVKSAICVPPVQCPAHVRNNTLTLPCRTRIGRKGVCCSTGQNHTERFEFKQRDRHLIRIEPKTLEIIVEHGRHELSELKAAETRIAGYPSAILTPKSPSYSHFRNSRVYNMLDLTRVMDVSMRALELSFATRTYKNREGLSNEHLELGMIQQDLHSTPLGSACLPQPHCTHIPLRHRRIDGACNNIIHPTWGTQMTPYSRLLPPSYHDGIWAPRHSAINGQPLPSARSISVSVISDDDIPEYDYTLMIMQFGQFLAHDITQSIDASHINGTAISCCSEDGDMELQPRLKHHACYPINIAENDFFYGRFQQRCMNFVRSVLAPNHDCTLGYSQQMNKITHFLDGSSIYGSTPDQTDELRSLYGGQLKVFEDFGRHLLPLSKDPEACLTMEQGSACFTSGDTRTNQMISLVIVHTIFLREHNRIADHLWKLNPHWSDEQLFLETRRIIIAQLQVITYKEFLPAVIGDIAMEEFYLHLGHETQYAYDYDANVNPSVTNEFATAALRFGHSIVDGLLKLYQGDKVEEMVSISEVMFQPSRLRKQPIFDELLHCLTSEPMQKVDNHIAEALTKYMFRGGGAFGVDLASLNIQRGRDHGLRPYNDYRELVGLPRIHSFDEFEPEIGERLARVYTSVDDIDLWVGGLLEEPAPGSIVGYTFRDIIADQFYRLKKGDRYFFENDPTINPGHFTPDQLIELRKASMSRLICDNSDGIFLSHQAPNAFRKPGVPGNEFVDCASNEIAQINLIYWRE